MGILNYPDDPPLAGFGAIDYRPDPDKEVDPDTATIVGAAFRQGNTVASMASNKMAGIDTRTPEDGFDGKARWDEIRGTSYESDWSRFAPMRNRIAFNAMKSQIDMEREDKRNLDAGGWTATIASLGAGLIDLPSLIPGGELATGVRIGRAAVTTGIRTGVAGALGAGASEIALQASQQTRPLSESALNVGSGAVLSALLGGGAGALMSAAERRAALQTVERIMADPGNANAYTEFRDGVAQGVNAQAVPGPVLEDYDIGKGAKLVGAAQAQMVPLLRAAHSPSAPVREIMSNMAETGYYLERNARGEGDISVESAVKEWDRGAVAKALKTTRELYSDGVKNGLNLTPEEFRTAVAKAMRRGDESEHDAVSKAAGFWRSTLFEPLKEYAIREGRLPPDVSVKTATSYLTRMWNAPRLTAEEARFKEIVRPWIDEQISHLEFKSDEIRLGNKIVDSDKAMETHDRLTSRVQNLEDRLAERTGSRQRRTDALTKLNQDRLDVLKTRAPAALVKRLRGADENAVMVDAVKQARVAERSAGKQQTFAERSPVLAIIKAKGGARVGSKLDNELRAMGVTPKSHPGMFVKKGGIGDVDNFVHAEDEIFANLGQDGNGYVDHRDLMEAIRSELAGNPLRTADEEAAAAALDDLDKTAAQWLDQVGLPADASVKQVRDHIARVQAAERNTEGLDTRISRFERELEEFDQATDAVVNEHAISKTELQNASDHLQSLEDEIAKSVDLAKSSPRVRLVVDYATVKRDIFKAKLSERSLRKRVDALRRMDAEGRSNDAMLSELAAKSIDLDRLQANIEGLKVKANKLEPLVPKVKQEIPDFVSDADRADYVNGIVNDIHTQLTGRARQGMPSYDMVMSDRGPMKERTFNIPDHLIEDFLEHDIEMIGRRYARVMATDIELARMDKRLGGKGDPTLQSQIDRVRTDYLQQRDAVNASALDQKEKAKALKALTARETNDVEDLAAVRDLLRGQYNVGGANTNFARVLRVVQAFNYVRSLGGVLVASATDAARPAMVHGFSRYVSEGVAPLFTNLKAIKLAVEDARTVGAVTENVLQSRLASMAELADPYSHNSPFERFIDNMSNTFSKLTLLPFWNDMHKSIGSVLTQNRVLKNVTQDYANLAAAERRYMGFVGINPDMAERIAKQFDQFGSIEGNVHVPGIDHWTDIGARRAFAAAINKDVDTIIVTKSVADVPLFTHTPAGRALIQFRSFAIASNQRVLMRGLQEGPRSFIQGTLAMMTLGMAAYYFKNYESNREATNNVGTLVAEGLDRAGVFPLAFEINNTWEKLGAPGLYEVASRIGMKIDPSADKRGPASRYANRDAFGALLGPSFQLGTDAAQLLGIPAQALSSLTDGDPSTNPDLKKQDIDRISKMIPFATLPYWRWAIEGGFGLGDSGLKPMVKQAVDAQ
ncbi:hypothetical protein [Mesorhizobium sp. B2-3-4]|uniref:hypothetical protein n=1 Tax=Mesorhizobium sp. B2-3-4 TaxID=2589959 RepID=UPI00112A823B|nr:hypothetical protein [Mesorhizobium sp. B2-3-4]TPM25715.1 hypothetical protein FJ967_32335 [Mesorhizobium sp. B2-3-4]